jgi:hypothetical protein
MLVSVKAVGVLRVLNPHLSPVTVQPIDVAGNSLPLFVVISSKYSYSQRTRVVEVTLSISLVYQHNA